MASPALPHLALQRGARAAAVFPRGRPASTRRCSRDLRLHASARGPALLVELDSVALDLHIDGHREAFNRTFHDFGYDCAFWTPHLYHDLLTHSDGRPESLVTRYFDTVGWPLTVTDRERPLFTSKVVTTKESKLKSMLAKDEVPLRPGFQEVVEAAVRDGAIIAGIAGTLSTQEHDAASSVLRLLGPDLAQHVRIFSAGVNQTPGDASPTNDDDSDAPLLLDAALSSEAAKYKSAEATRFVEALGELSSTKPGMAPVVVDASLATSAALASQRLSPQWFLAVSAALGVPACRCVALLGTASTCQAAAGAGAVPVAVPRKLAKSAAFPGARIKFDDMGTGGATWRRMATLVAVAQT